MVILLLIVGIFVSCSSLHKLTTGVDREDMSLVLCSKNSKPAYELVLPQVENNKHYSACVHLI